MEINKNNRAKILIVDDVVANLVAIEDTISNLDADIYRAESGFKALELVIEHEFALVLLDVQMPGMDGFETAQLMRQNKYSETVPIIFVTAMNKEKVHLFKGYESGAVDYLFKPLEPTILKSKVQIFLNIFYQKTQKLIHALDELQIIRMELEKNNAELRIISTQDSLTSLPNRLLFTQELDRTISFSKRYKERFAVLFFDIDNFKSINDNYGHLVGDKLLQEVSIRLKTYLRLEDFIARLGGDEFAIILSKISRFEDAGNVSSKICAGLALPFKIDENELSVTCSVGIGCYPFAGETQESLMKHADIAMYRAKEKGKNTFEYFSPSLSKEYERRSSIEKALQHGLERNEFTLVYQVIYDLNNNSPYGVETLIRWNSDALGEVSPAEFIPIAEDLGLIQPIGLWIIEKACEQFKLWHDEGMPYISYAINLSPKQLLKKDIFEHTQKVMQKNKIPPGNLELELTETAIMEESDVSENLLKRFNDIGIRINIDDFGTGYSSLIRLRYLPIHALKIDKSFVKDIFTDKNDAIIVKTILSLANSLGLKSIAEGIETKEQLEFLTENGCVYGQGYYLCRPVGADAVKNIFKRWRTHGQ